MAKFIPQTRRDGFTAFSAQGCNTLLSLAERPHPLRRLNLRGLSKLSGELVENQNDQIKRTFLRRTSHTVVSQTLQMELRRQLQTMLKQLDELQKPLCAKKDGCLHPWY